MRCAADACRQGRKPCSRPECRDPATDPYDWLGDLLEEAKTWLWVMGYLFVVAVFTALALVFVSGVHPGSSI